MIYLLDTNTVSDFLKRHSAVTASMLTALSHEDRLIIPPPVHYELIRSLVRHNATAQIDRLNNLILPQLEWVPLVDADWQQAAQYWVYAVSRGKQLSDIDLLIAAITQRLEAVLVTSDNDFGTLPIQRVNWRNTQPS